jgi:hypothetical protein
VPMQAEATIEATPNRPHPQAKTTRHAEAVQHGREAVDETFSEEGFVAMSVNADTYRVLCREDLDWLMTTPRTLERDHIQVILEWHIRNAEHVVELCRKLDPEVSK